MCILGFADREWNAWLCNGRVTSLHLRYMEEASLLYLEIGRRNCHVIGVHMWKVWRQCWFCSQSGEPNSGSEVEN